MNPQLADELRKALARGYCHAENSRKVLDSDLIEAMREEVEGLLAQHAVAEPQQKPWLYAIQETNAEGVVSWHDGEQCVFGDRESAQDEVDSLNDPFPDGENPFQIVPLYRIAAHAAEQPKLTEHVTAGFKEFSVSVDDEYDGYLSINVGTESASREQADFVEHAIKAALLTSPVAPPPQTFEKWFLLWDTTHDPEVKRLCGIAWSAGFTSRDWQPPDDAARPSQPETVGEAGRQPSNFLSSPTEQPPVAPGEQPDKRTVPPRPQAFPGPGAPYPSKTPSREQYEAAQEREGDDPFDDWFQASEWYAPGVKLELIRCAQAAWATAAKLAREGLVTTLGNDLKLMFKDSEGNNFSVDEKIAKIISHAKAGWGEYERLRNRALAAQQKKEEQGNGNS